MPAIGWLSLSTACHWLVVIARCSCDWLDTYKQRDIYSLLDIKVDTLVILLMCVWPMIEFTIIESNGDINKIIEK